jgi:hypothetical protein
MNIRIIKLTGSKGNSIAKLSKIAVEVSLGKIINFQPVLLSINSRLSLADNEKFLFISYRCSY